MPRDKQMSGSRKLLIISGLALAIWGMSYGLYYALFDEHQTLEQISVSLTTGFAQAAERNMAASHAALEAYAKAQFDYVREVDVHSHWTGLGMLLILFGLVFDHVAFDERQRFYLAVLFVLGSVIFPLGVILQKLDRGFVPQALAVMGSGFVIVALAGVALGLARRRNSGR